MYRKAIYLLSITAVSLGLALGGPLANAQDPKGPNDRPPGWDKGKKEGWGGADTPPGQQKKHDKNHKKEKKKKPKDEDAKKDESGKDTGGK